jgi:hypothetical protein
VSSLRKCVELLEQMTDRHSAPRRRLKWFRCPTRHHGR